MDYQELSFALQLRNLALDMQGVDRVKFQRSSPNPDMTKWEKENDFDAYMKIALNEATVAQSVLLKLKPAS